MGLSLLEKVACFIKTWDLTRSWLPILEARMRASLMSLYGRRGMRVVDGETQRLRIKSKTCQCGTQFSLRCLMVKFFCFTRLGQKFKSKHHGVFGTFIRSLKSAEKR